MHSGRTSSGRRMPSSPSRDGQATPSHQSQTSLPSIHQLHPDLPPSGGMSQRMWPGDTSTYGYAAPAQYAPHVDTGPSPSPFGGSGQRESELYGGADSDGDDYDHGPPKKKRRRQALSCTECKRRKIKCDRTQPCAPCTRRGEQSKCQWHIVEPVEKYVTRAEYDELKGRFEQLEALVRRLLPTTTVASTSMPYYQLAAHTGAGGASGVSVEAVQTYNPGTTPGVSGPIYPSMMPPPPPPPQGTYPQHIETSTQAPHRYIKTDDLQSGARHQNLYQQASSSMGGPATSPLLSTATHHTLPQHSPLLSSSPSRSHYRRSPEMLRSPSTTSATIKSSALSLSSITSPYNVNPDQSKNYHAQTLILGERLRPEFQAPSGPAVLFLGMVRQQRGRRLRGCTLTPLGRVGFISNSKRARRRPLFNSINLRLLSRHGDTAIPPP